MIFDFLIWPVFNVADIFIWNDCMEYAEKGTRENGQDRLITTDPEEKGMRVDVFLAARLGNTRSNVQHDLQEGLICREGKAVKANYKVKTGDVFQVP